MAENPLRTALLPLALLAFAGGASVLVLGGVTGLPGDPGVTLTAIAGLTAGLAAVGRATLPAVTAALAALGWGLGATTSGFVVTVAAALTVLGGVGFLVSTLHLAGKRTVGASPA